MLLFTFFQVYYTRRKNDHSNETYEKAKVIFNQILQQSENEANPCAFLYRQLSAILQQPTGDFDAHYMKRDFTCRSNSERFENCYQSIEEKLKEINLKLDSQCIYYLGLLAMSQVFPSFSYESAKSCIVKNDSLELDNQAINSLLTFFRGDL